MTPVYFGLSWLLGLWLAAILGLPGPVWAGLAGLAMSATIALRRGRHGRRRHGRRAAALGIALALGGGRYALAQPRLDAGHIGTYAGTAEGAPPEVVVTGLVAREPELAGRTQRLTVRAEALTLDRGATRAVEGQILVTLGAFPRVPYGARVRLVGRLETPPVFETFDYRDYLARRGVFAVMRYPRADVVALGEGNALLAGILAIKARASAVVARLAPEPEASLLRGILLGNDEGLPEGLREAFRRTGLSHIIAISGFNISLLGGWLLGLGAPVLGRRRAAWLALGGIAGYTVLVGADAAVVRAAIMGGLALTGNRLLGRTLYAPGLLFVAAWLMTVVNPFTLWDAGFQLSFAATLGLLLYADRFDRWTEGRLRAWLPASLAAGLLRFLSDAVLVTLAAQLATLPLILVLFRQASPISPLANLLALPAQPALMVSGGLATAIGLVSPVLAAPFGWVAWLLAHYTLAVARVLGAAPWAAVPVALGPVGAVALYAALAGLTLFFARPGEARRELLGRWLPALPAGVAVGLALAAACLALAWGRTQPDGLLHLTFFGAAEGGAILVRTPTGRTALLSGGPAAGLGAALGAGLPFWGRRLDLVLVGDGGERALEALPALWDRYRVGRLLISGGAAAIGGAGSARAALLAAAANQGTIVASPRAGTTLRVGDGVGLRAWPAEGRRVVWEITYGALRLDLRDAATPVAGVTVGEVLGAAGGPVEMVSDGRRLWWWTADP